MIRDGVSSKLRLLLVALVALFYATSSYASITTTFSGSLADPSNAALVGSDTAPSPPDFTDDDAIADNVALHVFTTGAAGIARLVSGGFAAGGVDPYFSLFAGSGPGATFVLSNYDQAFSTGGDFDIATFLGAGTYTLALGVFANESFAENGGVGVLGDGFIGFGSADYLHDATYRVSVTTVPEPSTLLLLGGLLLVLMLTASTTSSVLARNGPVAARVPFRTTPDAFPLENAMSIRRLVLPVCAALFAVLLVPATAHAQRATLVQSVDDPARTPYQQIIIFNQGPSTCTQFVCTVVFPVVPAGKTLEINYVSALFGAPNGSATINVSTSSSNLGVYLPLPQTYGLNTYVGASPVTVFVEAGARPVVTLGGFNVNASSTSAQAAVVGHLVTVP